MAEIADDIIEKVGTDLDKGVYPNLCAEACVIPAISAAASPDAGKRKSNYVQQFAGPRTAQQHSAGSFERGGQSTGSFSGRGAPRPASPPVYQSLEAAYLAQIEELKASYPSMRVRRLSHGMWFRFTAGLVRGQSTKAVFAVWVPFSSAQKVHAWGFWLDGPQVALIAGRHVNPIDGSICAFEERDHTWVPGDDLTALFDLYVMWAFRHLALKRGHGWYGYQSAFHPFERITEFADDDACGCDHPKGSYAECCKEADLSEDRMELARDYLQKFGTLVKGVPDETLLPYVMGFAEPPQVKSTLHQFLIGLNLDMGRPLLRALVANT